MHEREVGDLKNQYPFLNQVLRMVENGEEIPEGFRDTYLIARQRGLVGRKRDGEVEVSNRGFTFLDFLKK